MGTIGTLILKIFGEESVIALAIRIINKIIDNSETNEELKKSFVRFVKSLDIKTPIKLSDEMEDLIKDENENNSTLQ